MTRTRTALLLTESGVALEATVTHHTRDDRSTVSGPDEWYTVTWENDGKMSDLYLSVAEDAAIREAFPEARP